MSALAHHGGADDGAYVEALRHARPFVKSNLQHISDAVQAFPTYMMDWDRQRDAPLVYVRFPHVVLPDSWDCCLQIAFALEAGGLLPREAHAGSFGNSFQHHLDLGTSCPTIATASVARAAHRMTVSWAQYEEREDESIQAVVDDPTDPATWDPARCFPDRWPTDGTFDPTKDGGRPADLVIFRLFVDERGLDEGPWELREVLRRTLELHAAATGGAVAAVGSAAKPTPPSRAGRRKKR